MLERYHANPRLRRSDSRFRARLELSTQTKSDASTGPQDVVFVEGDVIPASDVRQILSRQRP